jgi:hypothetical protein
MMPEALTVEPAVTLTQRALLATLTIREWRARRYDKEVSAQVAKDHGAERKAGCYTKALLPKHYLEAIARLRSEARTFHWELTLPWSDDGYRILPVDLHLAYMERFRSLRARFESAVADFLAVYAEAKVDARGLLGSLYREADYPSTTRLAGAFEMSVSLQPLPTAHDWRVDLPAATVSSIRQDLEAQLREAQRLATADLYQRLAAVVSHMARTLGEPGKIFRNSLVGNIRDLCALLPRLNFTNDRRLAALTEDIEDRLATLQPAQLRADAGLRQSAAVDAAALLGTITERLASYTAGS